MMKEDKQLLLKDLSARLPYGIKASIPLVKGDERIYTVSFNDMKDFVEGNINIKPYLRPMSSMTEEEKIEYKHFVAFSGSPDGSANFIDWLNAHHFDYRTTYDENHEKWVSMIKKGLVIEAPEGMYNIKKK